MFLGTVIRMLTGLVVGIQVARYLGPSNYGALSYTLSVVGILSALSGMGTDYTLPRLIPSYPRKANEIVVAGIWVRCISSFVTVIAFMIIWLTDPVLKSAWVCGVVLLSLSMNPLTSIRYWYEAKMKSKTLVISELIGLGIGTCLKLVCLSVHASISAFIVATFVELIASIVIYSGIYLWTHHQRVNSRRVRMRVRSLGLFGYPFAISTIALLLHLKLDQIFLTHLVSVTESGLYAAAVRISEISYVVPVVLVSGLTGVLAVSRRNDRSLYYERLQLLFSVLAFTSIVISLAVTLGASHIIDFLYGEAYSKSAAILVIHIWSCIGIYQNAAASYAMNLERVNIWVIGKEVIATLINVGLNLLLIPQFGGIGAAIATAVSYTVNSILLNLIHPKTRAIGIMQLKSYTLIPLVQRIRTTVRGPD